MGVGVAVGTGATTTVAVGVGSPPLQATSSSRVNGIMRPLRVAFMIRIVATGITIRNLKPEMSWSQPGISGPQNRRVNKRIILYFSGIIRLGDSIFGAVPSFLDETGEMDSLMQASVTN